MAWLFIALGVVAACVAATKGGWFAVAGGAFAIGSIVPKLLQHWRGDFSAIGASLVLDTIIATICIIAVSKMEGSAFQLPKSALLAVAVFAGGSVTLHAYFFFGMAAQSRTAMITYTALVLVAWLLMSIALIAGGLSKRNAGDEQHRVDHSGADGPNHGGATIRSAVTRSETE